MTDNPYESARAPEYLHDFFGWLGATEGDIPRQSDVMEYLWGEVPLRYGHVPEIAEEIRVAVGQYLSRNRLETDTRVDNVAWDKRTFQRRMRDVTRIPRELWLYELRRIVELEGSIPRPGSPWSTAEFPTFDLAVEDAPPVDLPRGFKGFPPFEHLAANCAAVADIKALVEVIGEGSKLTTKGNLGLAEARRLADKIGLGSDFDEKIGNKTFKTKSSTEIEPVDLAFRWARVAGFVKVTKGVIAPTKRGRALGTKPADEWWSLFVSFVRDLKWLARRWPPDRRWFWVGEVAGLWRHYLESIRSPMGIDIESLRDQAWGLVDHVYDIDDLTPEQVSSQKRFVESSIRHGFFEPLAMLNAIDPATLKGNVIKPTALGRWAAERFAYVMEGGSGPSEERVQADNVIRLRDFRKKDGD